MVRNLDPGQTANLCRCPQCASINSQAPEQIKRLPKTQEYKQLLPSLLKTPAVTASLIRSTMAKRELNQKFLFDVRTRKSLLKVLTLGNHGLTSTSSKGSDKHLPVHSHSSAGEVVRPQILGWRTESGGGCTCRQDTDTPRPNKNGCTSNLSMEAARRRRRRQGSGTMDGPQETGRWEVAHCNLFPKSRICRVQPRTSSCPDLDAYSASNRYQHLPESFQFCLISLLGHRLLR